MVTASQLQILQSPITGLISSVSSSVSVKLDDSNYLQWHFQMQLLLEGYGIMNFVDGSSSCPPQFSSTSSSDSDISFTGSHSRVESDDYKVWKMHDRALMHLMTATLSSSAISCAIGSTSARDLWVRLQDQFSVVSRTAIFQMKSNLYTIKKGPDSMTQYLQRIKEARDFLAAAGVTFADEDIVILALNGLPSEYNTFRCVIRGRENVISLKDFRFQLLVEEVFVQNNSSIPFLSAMVAQDQGQGSKVSITANYGHGSSASIGFTQNLGFQSNDHSSLYASSGGNGGTGHNQFFYSKSKDTCKFQYNQGQRYSNPKHVVHDFTSQFNNGASYSTITCQLCAQQGHSAANCIYRITASSEPCQICNRRNHSVVTCLYRNMTYSSTPPMTTMHTSFPGQHQSYAMPSHLSKAVRCGKGQFHSNNGPRFNTYQYFPQFSLGVLGSPPSLYPNSLPSEITTHQICSQKDHVDDDCLSASSNVVMGFVGYPNVGNSVSEQHKSDLSENEHSVDDDGEDELEFDRVLEDLNSFDLANELATMKKVTVRTPPTPHNRHKHHETPLQSHFHVEIHTQTVVHEFCEFYVLRLCKGGRIFDIQLGYHMRISDKGGGTKFTLIW